MPKSVRSGWPWRGLNAVLQASHGGVLLLLLAITCGTTGVAVSESYQLKRLWPTLQQPWYFFRPTYLALDLGENVFLADTDNNRVLKLTTDGQFITTWGSPGSGPGQFDTPTGIGVDSDGFVYVSDSENNRIQKFTSSGVFVLEWGRIGFNPGEFIGPQGIGIGLENQIYVADSGNQRIQEFSGDGTFVREWGEFGFDPGEFLTPFGVATGPDASVYVSDTFTGMVQRFTRDGTPLNHWDGSAGAAGAFVSPWDVATDAAGNVYVADTDNARIQYFTAEGSFQGAWGKSGAGLGEFRQPTGLAADSAGHLYVVDRLGLNIQKFSVEGDPLDRWGSKGRAPGFMDLPGGAAVGPNGDLFVADTENYRVQRFTADGRFLRRWGSKGTGNGQFLLPFGIAADSAGFIYVVDYDGANVQKFDADGIWQARWGTSGSGDGQFAGPTAAGTDSAGNVYVTDTVNNRVQKFDSNGQYLSQWGSVGNGPGQFDSPIGIAVGADDRVYVVDSRNNRVQKFTKTGTPVAQWGASGVGDGQFDEPKGIALDAGGNVYVADTGNHRIQKFTAEGGFLNVWGAEGTNPGDMLHPAGLAIGTTGESAGLVYVADQFNDRIQAFKALPVAGNAKAIVVAAGGGFPGNNLWDATQLCANFAYRTLTYQGFDKDRIQYLSSDLDLDLDNNGAADDVDADASNANLRQAIRTWALTGGTEHLTLYLVDHGGDAVFRMSGTETLNAPDLDSWLDEVQDGAGQDISGTLTIVYEACESGSFKDILAPSPGQQRVVITSTSPNESAYFLSQGSVSFSMFFWTHVFNGSNVLQSYDLAVAGMAQAIDLQTPLLVDSPGDGSLAQATHIGNGTEIVGDTPVIVDWVAPHAISGTNIDTIWASPVTDSDGVLRVWAMVQPPDFVPTASTNPVQDLPNFNLSPVGGNRFESRWDGFTTPGLYQLAIYARDRVGDVSAPVLTTVSVDSPLHRRAIIVVGGTPADPRWPGFEYTASRAYSALKAQGYTDADIAFRSPFTFDAGIDGAPSLSNLEYLLTAWGTFDTYDLVLYLTGPAGSGSFTMGTSEFLDPATLDGWLDILQTTIPGKTTVIIEADQSGSFIPYLLPTSGKNRIVIASAGSTEVSRLGVGGSVSFSNYFWTNVLDGEKVRPAFQGARNAMRFSGGGQLAVINDNGNAIGNEKLDGILSQNYTIGMGKRTAGDAPYIDTDFIGADPSSLVGATSSTIWAADVTTTGTIDVVAAAMFPPGYQEGDVPIEVTLNWSEANDRYEGVHAGFDVFGVYTVAIVARDSQGQVSTPAETTVTQADAPDAFEPDDSAGSAAWITLDGPDQLHNFHAEGNEDWVKFFAHAGDVVAVETFELGTACDTLLSVYQGDGLLLLGQDDDLEFESFFQFNAGATDYYFAKIEISPTTPFVTHGPDTGYRVKVYQPIGACIQAGSLRVYVHEGSLSGPALGEVEVSLVETAHFGFPQAIVTGPAGVANFGFSAEGTYRVAASRPGYTMAPQPDVFMACGQSLDIDVVLLKDAGATPALQVTPGGWEFGPVAVGTSMEKVLTLRNTGGGTATGNASTVSPFGIVSGGGYSVGSGQDHAITVRFTPSQAQGFSEQLSFSGSSVVATLSGSGYNPATGVIGDVNIDGLVDVLDVTLINLYIVLGFDIASLNAQLQGLGLNPMVAILADVDRKNGTTGLDGALINAQLLLGKTALNAYLSSNALAVSHAGEPLP